MEAFINVFYKGLNPSHSYMVPENVPNALSYPDM